jgi:long-chain fatty acid transport protein
MRRVFRYSLVCAISLLATRSSLADGVIFDGLNARTIGRGGTNIAHSDNGAILHDNPSAMVNIDGEGMFELGATGLFTDLHYADPQNSNTAVSQLYAMPEVSFIKRTPDGDWAYGVGIFAPAGFGSRFYLEGPPGPLAGEQLYKSFACLGRILPAIAYKATDRLSVGATLGCAVLVGDLEGPFVLQSGALAGTPTIIDLDAGGAALTWSAGLTYELTDDTTFGLTYQNANRFKAHGTTNVEIPGLGSSNYDTRMNITFPQSVGAGLRHELCPHRIVSLDAVWYDWSGAFDDITLQLSSPSTPGFPPTTQHLPLNWRDSLSIRLGYEMKFDNFKTLRFGYVHHRSPIPANTMTPYIPAALENAFSTGYGMRLFGWNADIAYMFSFGPTVNEGTSAIIGGDFDNSQSWDRTHALALTLMRAW